MLRRIRRGFAHRLPTAFVLVVATVVAMFVLVNVVIQAKLASADRVDLTTAETPSGGGANYLMIGSDTRSFVADANDEEAFGDEADAGGQRSDTIMVLHTDPDSERALLVSFPRDLWVDIPGRGSAKLNSAFNDGPQAVIDALSNDFDVPIQHYVEVNFDSFREIVNAVGTIPVFFPAPARDKLSGLNVVAPGCFQLDGPAALSFVRSRNLEILDPASGKWENADAIPDLGRIGRQQAFLRAVGKRAMDAALTNPFKANSIIDSAISRLRLDDGFGRGDVFNLADALAAGEGGPESQTVPTEPTTRGGQSVLEATPEAEAVLGRLRDFETVVPAAPEAADPGAASPGDTRVRVLNASGEVGAAGKALTMLVQRGFAGVGSGNADTSRSTTEIHHQPDAADKAALVATFVRGPVKLVEDEGVQGADVTLVIGSGFAGIGDPAPAAPAPAPGASAPAAQPTSLAPIPGC